MNCKPGDMALCVKGEHSGKTCEVIVRGETYREIATGAMLEGWLVAFPSDVQWGKPNGLGDHSEGWYPDAWLRPIRDPGDDARDESLSWLPAPVASKEVA